MTRLALTLLLLLLVSCAETPSKPTTSGGSSSGSGKVVTATPEDPYECDSDLILEPHLPEECIPPEPPEPVVQKPVEPPKPDPIVGTYHIYFTEMTSRQSVLRVYADGLAIGADQQPMRWFPGTLGGVALYRFYKSDKFIYDIRYSSDDGEPNLEVISKGRAWPFEGVKKSNDPDFLFDLFVLTSQGPRGSTYEDGVLTIFCANIGHKDRARIAAAKGSPPNFAKTIDECEELCAQRYDLGRASGGVSCPQDRR